MPFIDELRAEEQVQEGVVTEPPESDGTFLSTLRAEATEEASQADYSLTLSGQLQPEHEAKVYDLSKRTGYDVPTVRTDPAKVERQANSYVPGTNEKLDRYYGHSLVEGQPNAAISADDWEPLLKVHDTVEKHKGIIRQNLERITSERVSLSGILQTDLAALATGAMEVPRTAGRIADKLMDYFSFLAIDEPIEKVASTRHIQDFLRSKYGDTLVEQWSASAMESFGQMLTLNIGSGGDRAITLYGMATSAGTQKLEEAEAAGADPAKALLIGIEAAVVEYWTEKIPIDEMLGPGKKFIRKLLVGGVSDMAGELLATTNEIYVNQSLLGKQYTKDEIKQALLDTVVISAMMTAGGTTATHPFVKNRDIDLSETKAQTQLIEKDKAFHESIEEERAVIKETKTNERSKDHMKEVLKSLDKTEDVYIAPEGIKTLLQTQSEQAATAILQKVNVGLSRAQEAMREGQDIAVNVADILTLEDEDYNILKQDIKEAPGAYTQRDLTENIAKEDTENVSKRIQEIESEQKPVDEEIARITKEQNDRAKKEQKKLAKELDIETGRIEAEVDAARLPETKLAKDAATILRGIAERLQLFGIDPVQRLKNITVKRTPIQEFIAKGKALFQPSKPVDNTTVFTYQNTLPEKIIHEGWDRGNSARYDLEGAGDILREYTKATPDLGYIDEKLRRLDRTLTRIEETGRIHPDDHIDKARLQKNRPLERLREAYEKQPTISKPQEAARQLLLAYIDGNYKRVRQFHDIIKNESFDKVALPLNRGDEALFQTEVEGIDRALDRESAELFVRRDRLLKKGVSSTDPIIQGIDKRIEAISQKMRDRAFRDYETFLQTDMTGTERGAVVFNNERRVIHLFENADLSTVLHEVGHIALLEYSTLEKSPDVSQELKDDMRVIREWVGAKEGEALTRDQSEQFARGFEAYLMEGKAPTSALRAAFERFKNYLRSIYQSAKDLNVELNDEVRAVFDRMLGTNLEVELAARTGGFVAKTDTEMNALGMNDADKKYAKRLISRTLEKANELLSKDRNASYRENRDGWYWESISEVNKENPVYNIVADITKSRIDVDELNIIRKEVEAGSKTRHPVRDAEGNIIQDRFFVENTYPEYFKNRGFTKKYVLNVIDKALRGEELTPKQSLTLDILIDAYRDEVGRAITEQGGNPVFKEDLRIDRQEFVDTYGEDAINDLYNKNILTDDGASIDSVALTYDYESGDAFMRAVFDTLPLDEAIKRRVEQKQREHDAQFRAEDYFADIPAYRDYQELMGRYIGGATVSEADIDAGIQRNIKRWEAEAKEQNPDATPQELTDIVQDKIDEYRQKQLKPKTVARDTLKRLAKETIEAKTVSEAQQVHKFLAAMKRAANDERRAIMRKDWGAAARANELGRFNYEMASLSKNIKEEVNKDIENAKKIAGQKQGVLEHEYQEAILHLTSRYNLFPKRPTEPIKLPDYNRLLAGDIAQFDQKGNRIDPNIASGGVGVPAFFGANITDYRGLRVDQFRQLDEVLRFLNHQGKRGKSDFFSDGMTRVDDVMAPIIKEMDKQKGEIKRDKHDMLKGVSEGLDKWYARMFNISYITKALGGYKSLISDQLSVLEQYVTERLKDMRDAHLNMRRAYRTEIKPHRDRLVESQRKLHRKYGTGASSGNVGISLKEAKLYVKDNGVPVPSIIQNNGEQVDYWEVEQVFDMAFHRMNEGNTQALVNGYGLTVEQIDTLLDKYLTKQDMRDVQAIINIMGKLAPETNETHMRINGFPMRMVEARPFTFKGEQFAGGYYPLNIDRKLASVENDVFGSIQEMEDYYKTTDSVYVVPYAKSTHTLTRKDGHGLPVQLSLRNIDEHVDQAVRYITMAEGIRDVDRIITYRKKDTSGKVISSFKASATRVMGENVYKQIRPALKHFANPTIEGVDTPGRWFVNYLRGLAVPAHLAWKTITGVKQLGSIPLAIHELGKDGRSGLKKYTKGVAVVGLHPTYSYHTMLQKSDFMQERLNTWERDFLKSRFDSMTPAQREISFGDRHVTWSQVKDLGFATVRIPDLIAVTPAWWAGYMDKIEQGATEKEAVRFADNVIEDTQPTAQPLDLSAWLRDGGYWSVFNLHQTFTVGIHGQRQRIWKKGFKKGKISLGKYVMYNYMEVVVPSALSATIITLLRGGDISDPEDQKDILFDILSYAFGAGTPMLGSVLSMLFKGTKYAPIEMAGGREAQQTLEGLHAGWMLLSGLDDMNRKERERAIWALAKAISIQLKVPVSDIAQQLFEGDTAMEKIFKPKRKKK